MKEKEWDLIYSKRSLKFLKKLKDKKLLKLLKEKAEELKTDPQKGKLLSGNLSGFRKLVISYTRPKDYRIVYRIIDDRVIIYISEIDKRKNIYKKK